MAELAGLAPLHHHWKIHATVAGISSALAVALAIFVLRVTHYNLAAIISVTAVVTAAVSSLPLAISYGTTTVFQGVIAGIQLRREGIMPVIGQRIIVNMVDGVVVAHASRHITMRTTTGYYYPPNTALLAGFQKIDTVPPPPPGRVDRLLDWIRAYLRKELHHAPH